MATPNPSEHGTALIGANQTDWIEQQIDHFDSQLSDLTNFILPAGAESSAALHHARVVCRRAERRVVTLSRATELSSEALTYLNRVGDLLFVLARFANQQANREGCCLVQGRVGECCEVIPERVSGMA